MDRRTALKNISLSLGYSVATPTIFNILTSCNAQVNGWSPLFLTPEEKHIVINLADIILPKTNTPGALDVNVPQFLDLMYFDIEKKSKKVLFHEGALVFSEYFKNTFKTEVIKGKKDQFETLLTSFFKLSDDASETILKQQKLPFEKIPKSQQDDYTLYHFLLSVKRYTLFGYFTSQKVGEEVLNYDPVPGSQVGCLPIEDVPNGHTWSL